MALCRHVSLRVRRKVKWGLACVGVESPEGGGCDEDGIAAEKGDGEDDDADEAGGGQEDDEEEEADEEEEEEAEDGAAETKAKGSSACSSAKAPPPARAKATDKGGEKYEYGYDEEPLARKNKTLTYSPEQFLTSASGPNMFL